MSETLMPVFELPRQQFTLHNATPKPINVRWAGRMFVIPPVDVVGPNPAADSNGKPIPGTTIVMDCWTVGPTGEVVNSAGPPNWLASEAIRNILGINPETRQAEGDYAQGGVSFLPNRPTPQVIERVRADGARRYKASMRDWSRETISAYETAIDKAKKAGVPARPLGPDYAQAVQVLQEEAAEFQGLRDQASGLGDELEFMTYAKAKAQELAEKAKVSQQVDRARLAEELLQDENILEHLRKNYRLEKLRKGTPSV